jgi:hypothetical protein
MQAFLEGAQQALTNTSKSTLRRDSRREQTRVLIGFDSDTVR